MTWGNPFSSAWSAASDAARSSAAKVATGAKWVGQQSNDAAQWAAGQARRGLDQAAAFSARVESTARAALRQGVRKAADRVFDSAAAGAEAGRVVADGVSNTYTRAKELFGAKKVGIPVQPCPSTASAAVPDASHDGWMMAPQGQGKQCVPIPPGPNATQQARQQAVISSSSCCRARRAAGETSRDIIYVNGINTTSLDHCRTLNAIAEQTCARVVGVYNAHEGDLTDKAQTGQDRRLIKQANAGKRVPTRDGRNPAVDTLQDQVSKEIREGRSPEIWAHSQGGAVTSLALYEVRNDLTVKTGDPNPLAGVKVTSFGAAAPSWVDGPSYEHYIHANDLTPSLFGLGHSPDGDTRNAGRGATVHRFSGEPGSFVEEADLRWLPAKTANHGVEEIYLRMEKQINGGCP